MTKEKFNISLLISIVTIIFSIGVSWGIVKSKTDKIDRVEIKAEDTEKKMVAVETQVSNMKDDVKEIKGDIKEILKELKK